MIGIIARREVKGLYGTATGWLALAAGQLLIAWLLFAQLEVYQKIQPRLSAQGSSLGITDLVITPALATTALILLILVPLLGMRAIAAERQSGRLALLLSAPVSAPELVLGKWLGLVAAALPLALLALVMALALGMGSHLDWGRLAASAIGLTLVLLLAAAVSLWFSSISEQPLTTAALSWGLLILLWQLDSASGQGLRLLSIKTHLTPLFTGVINSATLIYFATLTLAALALTMHRLWRLGGGD